MRQIFWYPTSRKAHWARLRARGIVGLIVGLVVAGGLVIVPLAGRLGLIDARFYTDPNFIPMSPRTPPTWWAEGGKQADTGERRIGGDIGARRLNHTKRSKQVVKESAVLVKKPLVSVMGSDQDGQSVLWRLIYGSEFVVVWGGWTAVGGLMLGLVWGVGMGWWSPVLFPGYHRQLKGLRHWLGRFACFLYSVFDLFPRIILLLFLTSIGGITLLKSALAIGLVIALQVAAGVRRRVIDLRESDTVLAAEELGMSPFKIVWVHIVRYRLSGFLMSQAAYALGVFVLWQSTLTFIGFLMVGHDSWGEVIYEGGISYGIPWMLWPGLALIVTTTVAMFKLGDAIEQWEGR